MSIDHPFSQLVTDQIKFLHKEYGQKDPFTVVRGKVHECLGATVDFRNRGYLMLNKHDYIKKIWNSLPNYLRGAHRSTPAPENMFKVYVESPGEKISVSFFYSQICVF